FLPRVWLAKDPFGYMASPLAIATWVAVFPVIVAFIVQYFDESMNKTYMGVDGFVYVYPLRFVRANLSVQICFTPIKSSLFKMSKLLRKGLKIGTTILFTFLTVAAWIHIITYKQYEKDMSNNLSDVKKLDSNKNNTINYLDAIWFTVVVLYIMVMGAIFIPTHLTELINLIQQRSKYDHSFKYEKNLEHIIVTGNFDAMSLFEFLREFFCQDHGMTTMNTIVLVLNPEE
ncbi:10204_t:CDS:2, partial [Scutellospora calospora]